MEGYSKAAANFSKEANVSPQQGIDTMHRRQQIIHLILGGKIQDAIEALNDIDPEVGLIHHSPVPCTYVVIRSLFSHAPLGSQLAFEEKQPHLYELCISPLAHDLTPRPIHADLELD